MDTVKAYAALVRELEAIRARPPTQLLALIDQPPIRQELTINGATIELEFVVTRPSHRHPMLHIAGHARGPGTWHSEHLQESIAVDISPAAD